MPDIPPATNELASLTAALRLPYDLFVGWCYGDAGDRHATNTVLGVVAEHIDLCQYARVRTKREDTTASRNTVATGDVCCAVVSRVAMTSDEATRTASLLKVLGDPIRLRIVSLVAAAESGEICACDLPALLERSQGTISHHLKQLVEARILEREQRGKWAWFRLNEATLEAISEALLPADR